MMALETADIPNDEERFRSPVPVVFGRLTNVRRTTIVGQCSGRKIICLHQPTHTQRPTTLYVPLQRCGVVVIAAAGHPCGANPSFYDWTITSCPKTVETP